MGETEQQKPPAEVRRDGKCSICGESAAEQGKALGHFCQYCGAKLKQRSISEGGSKKTEVFVSKGQVEMKPPVSKSSEVEPDPAGRHDADAARAALGGLDSDFEYGETEDPAGVIDVRGHDWVPGKGYVKKKDEK